MIYQITRYSIYWSISRYTFDSSNIIVYLSQVMASIYNRTLKIDYWQILIGPTMSSMRPWITHGDDISEDKSVRWKTSIMLTHLLIQNIAIQNEIQYWFMILFFISPPFCWRACAVNCNDNIVILIAIIASLYQSKLGTLNMQIMSYANVIFFCTKSSSADYVES